MAHLMGENGDDFVRWVLVDEGVTQDDTARVPDAGQRGIGSLGAFRHIELGDSAHFRIGAQSTIGSQRRCTVR